MSCLWIFSSGGNGETQMLPQDASPPPPTEQLIFYDTSVVHEIKQNGTDQKKGQH